ncbi:MAG: lysophospholipid acyltransferase family protein [Ignavibacteriaceae bacterium]|nr:lysophospholipid acyltransferase family protein [Ignavibacteriaceae bacterium]
MNKTKQKFLQFLGRHLTYGLVMGVCRSLKAEVINYSPLKELLDKNARVIIAFWHSTMLYPWYFHRGRNMMGLTSQSKDGEILARVLRKWGYQTARGSSHKGGKVALEIMVDYARFEGSVCITPDGPTGPVYKFKPGAVVSAKKASVPLVMLGVAYENAIKLKSWDRFEIPKPFTKVRLIFSDPVYIDKDTEYEKVSEMIIKCEEQLNGLQSEAGKF